MKNWKFRKGMFVLMVVALGGCASYGTNPYYEKPGAPVVDLTTSVQSDESLVPAILEPTETLEQTGMYLLIEKGELVNCYEKPCVFKRFADFRLTVEGDDLRTINGAETKLETSLSTHVALRDMPKATKYKVTCTGLVDGMADHSHICGLKPKGPWSAGYVDNAMPAEFIFEAFQDDLAGTYTSGKVDLKFSSFAINGVIQKVENAELAIKTDGHKGPFMIKIVLSE